MRNYLKLVALLVAVFVGLSACDLFGDDDDDGTPAVTALGATLSINDTITQEVNFDPDIADDYVDYSHLPGRTFFLLVGSSSADTEADTDDNDDATVTLTTGEPNGALLGTPDEILGVGLGTVTSSNANAEIAFATIVSSDGLVGREWYDSSSFDLYSEFYVYSSADTVLGGTGETTDDIVSASLSAGWNAVRVFEDADSNRAVFGASVPGNLSDVFVFELF